jgi:hypothetical protein
MKGVPLEFDHIVHSGTGKGYRSLKRPIGYPLAVWEGNSPNSRR